MIRKATVRIQISVCTTWKSCWDPESRRKGTSSDSRVTNYLLPCNLLFQSMFKHTFFPLRYFQMSFLVPRTCVLCLPSCLVSNTSSNLSLALSLLKKSSRLGWWPSYSLSKLLELSPLPAITSLYCCYLCTCLTTLFRLGPLKAGTVSCSPCVLNE